MSIGSSDMNEVSSHLPKDSQSFQMFRQPLATFITDEGSRRLLKCTDEGSRRLPKHVEIVSLLASVNEPQSW